jgi:paraquat-inducible protein B
MGKRANPAVVGAFVIGAVVLAVIAVAAFGSGRLFRTTFSYVVYFSGDVNGLKVGAPVKFKGVEIGSVSDILLNISQLGIEELTKEQAGEALIPVIIELDADMLSAKGGRLVPNRQTIKRLIRLGLRAQLSMESFVTGLLYVKMDLHPASPINLVADPTVDYFEIPTLPTPLQEAQAKAAAFLARLDKLDIEGIVESIGNSVTGLDRLINSPALKETIDALPQTVKKVDAALVEMESALVSVRKLSADLDSKVDPVVASLQQTAADAGKALQAAEVTLQRVSDLLEPDSPVVYRLGRSLDDLSQASRAIRRFAEDLERNPSILVRGKAIEDEE